MDRYATSEENYISKVICYANYIGLFFDRLVNKTWYLPALGVFIWALIYKKVTRKLI